MKVIRIGFSALGLLLALGCSGSEDSISQEEKDSLAKEMALDAIEVEKNKEKVPDLQIDLKNLCSLAEKFPWNGKGKALRTTFIDKARTVLNTNKISKRFDALFSFKKEERMGELKKLLSEHGVPTIPCDKLNSFLKEDYANL